MSPCHRFYCIYHTYIYIYIYIPTVSPPLPPPPNASGDFGNFRPPSPVSFDSAGGQQYGQEFRSSLGMPSGIGLRHKSTAMSNAGGGTNEKPNEYIEKGRCGAILALPEAILSTVYITERSV